MFGRLFLSGSRCRLSLEDRRKPECGTLAHLTLHADLPLHEGHEFFDDREAESRATEASGGCAVGLGKGFENALMRLGWNADTGIFYLESKGDGRVRFRHRIDAHIDLAFGRELQGVTDEIQ